MTDNAVKLPRKGRTATRKARRRQLIDSTIDSIAKRGFTETTLAAVTKGAKLSHGIVNFHFQSKELLLLETLRFLAEEHHAHWLAALEKAGPTPKERLRAIIEADFHPSICNTKKLAVWFAFWGKAKSRPEYMDICGNIDLERLTELERLCRLIIEEGGYAHSDPWMIAKGLESMVDGLWLNLLIHPKSFRRSIARRTCFAFIAGMFPRHFPLTGEPQKG